MEAISVFGLTHGSQLSRPSCNHLFPVRKVSCFPLTLFPGKRATLFRLNATTSLTCDDQESNHTFKFLPTSEWTNHFHSLSINVTEVDALRKEIHELKPKVKNTLMMMSSQGSDFTKKRILMIYLLVSLGLAHHFEDEIYETLKEGFGKIEEMMAGEDDLFTVSIIFWVFRRYGHHISSDIFRRFKSKDGYFKEDLMGDAKGMLSLYDAAHLGTTKEYIPDEALSFTSSHLESLAVSRTCPPHLSVRIRNSLVLSQHFTMEIVVPLEYISFYEQEKDHDEMLLKFAKLSFKFVKLQYLQELKVITKWYKGKEFASTLPPFFRDRIVENYFFVLAVFYEPQLSRERIMLTKFFTCLEIIDDTFDRYASLSEAESLAKSVERWAPDDSMAKQPDYLKFVLKFLLDTFEEFEQEHMSEGTAYSVKATIEEFKIYVKANLNLAKWALTGQVPSFEDYLEVSEVEIAVYATLAGMFMSMGGNMDTKEAYEWLESRPKSLLYLSYKCRVRNDITGFEDDMIRGYVTNSVNCYMKQHGATKNDAIRELNKMVAEWDKIMNEEFLATTGVPRRFIKATIDFARMAAVTYNVNDGFTQPTGIIKEYMTSMFIDL